MDPPVTKQSNLRTAVALAVWADKGPAWQWLVNSTGMTSKPAFLELVDAVTFKDLHSVATCCPPLSTAKCLPLPSASWYVARLKTRFQNILVSLVLASSRAMAVNQFAIEQ